MIILMSMFTMVGICVATLILDCFNKHSFNWFSAVGLIAAIVSIKLNWHKRHD